MAPRSAPFRPRSNVLRWIPFQDQDRGSYLLVAIGANASAQNLNHAAAILDSLILEQS